MALYDDGITDTSAVMEHISRVERAWETVSKIKKLYGIGGRALTSKENKFFASWTEVLGYDIEVITLAYEITIDNKHEPIPRYTNAILEQWHAEGLKNAAEVRRYLDSKSAKRAVDRASLGDNFDVEEFFNAALARSFEYVD